MFESLSRDKQGDLGEARAVYELVRLGYFLSKPLHVHVPYDFVAEKDSIFYRVQVKTSRLLLRKSTNVYQIQLATTGGNRKINTRQPFNPSKIDLLFVMTQDDRCWLIPADKIAGKTNITVGTKQYNDYQIAGKKAERKVVKPQHRTTNKEKQPPFSVQELKELLWKYPTTKIGKMFNMSDNGVARWAKKWNLQKPKRGYWQKLNTNNL